MDKNFIIDNSLDLLEELKEMSSETIGLAIFAESLTEGEVIAAITGVHSFNFKPEVGHHFPLHSTAPGKTFLAALPSQQLKTAVKKISLTKFTEKTITDFNVLSDDLELTRSRGFSLDCEEAVPGLNCIGTAIKNIDGFPIAAIWITGPVNRFPVEQATQFSHSIIETALKISARVNGQEFDSKNYQKYVVGLAKEYMWEHLNESIEMPELAEKMHVDYCWFRRNFKKQTGLSPNQYHMQLKFEKAERLLRHTNLTIKEISNQLGYKTQDYFSAIFKKKTGLSPSAYRENQ